MSLLDDCIYSSVRSLVRLFIHSLIHSHTLFIFFFLQKFEPVMMCSFGCWDSIFPTHWCNFHHCSWNTWKKMNRIDFFSKFYKFIWETFPSEKERIVKNKQNESQRARQASTWQNKILQTQLSVSSTSVYKMRFYSIKWCDEERKMVNVC